MTTFTPVVIIDFTDRLISEQIRTGQYRYEDLRRDRMKRPIDNFGLSNASFTIRIFFDKKINAMGDIDGGLAWENNVKVS